MHECLCAFQGALKQSHVYPKCDVNRYVDGSIGIPQKVLKHFLLIPQLLCMHRCKNLEELLIWHKNEASVNGLVYFMLDSKSWKHITNKWAKFVNDAYKIRLGLAQVMGEPIWRFEFLPFYMASHFVEL
jgi:hypothetical protein